MIFSLFILMGVSWMMEIISFWVGEIAYLWIPTDILNISTGVFVFIIFVCKPHVWKLLKIKCPYLVKLDRCCPSCMLQRTNSHQSTSRSDSRQHQQTTMNQFNNHNEQQESNGNRKNAISCTSTGTTFSQIRDSATNNHSNKQ